MSTILWYPEKINWNSEPIADADRIEVKKIYDKTPLIDGNPLTDLCEDSQGLLSKVRSLKKSYYFTY
ncbi:hypothetical protein [Fredinandcohnia sp. 179-A 10B2 NHS]|uniref:hypothetical protein n=1 Tax=Fredinandcohnia sp. 179-A 10B2 NHS TaxID=3235176 RepID=UPI0039A065BB